MCFYSLCPESVTRPTHPLAGLNPSPASELTQMSPSQDTCPTTLFKVQPIPRGFCFLPDLFFLLGTYCTTIGPIISSLGSLPDPPARTGISVYLIHSCNPGPDTTPSTAQPSVNICRMNKQLSGYLVFMPSLGEVKSEQLTHLSAPKSGHWKGDNFPGLRNP